MGKSLPPVLSPFEFGLALLDGGRQLAATARRLGEAATAAGEVIDARGRLIADATRDPVSADYREFARFVPEKIEAFSQAGLAAFAEIVAFQFEFVSGWQQLMLPLMAGRLPTSAEAAGAASRSSRMWERAAGAGGRSLAPVHRAVTENASRLKRRPRG